MATSKTKKTTGKTPTTPQVKAPKKKAPKTAPKKTAPKKTAPKKAAPKECEEGKVRDPNSKKCRNPRTTKRKPCKEGQVRDPESKRCRNPKTRISKADYCQTMYAPKTNPGGFVVRGLKGADGGPVTVPAYIPPTENDIKRMKYVSKTVTRNGKVIARKGDIKKSFAQRKRGAPRCIRSAGSKQQVYKGTRFATQGWVQSRSGEIYAKGNEYNDLEMNPRGRIVSKKRRAHGMKVYEMPEVQDALKEQQFQKRNANIKKLTSKPLEDKKVKQKKQKTVKKTVKQKTAECQEQGLVYNRETNNCRPSKRQFLLSSEWR